MKKGKFGIDLRFFAILAFVFAFTGWTVPVVMILGYAILAEKDEWLTRQSMQATMLLLLTSVYGGIVDLFARNFGVYQGSIKYLSEVSVGEWVNYIYFLIINIIQGILYIIVAILTIVAIVNVIKGKDAGLPLFSKWSYKAYGILPSFHQPQAPQQPQGQAYQQPQQYQQQPQQYQQQPQAQQYQAPYNGNTPPTQQ